MANSHLFWKSPQQKFSDANVVLMKMLLFPMSQYPRPSCLSHGAQDVGTGRLAQLDSTRPWPT